VKGERSALVTWQTNKPATSEIFWVKDQQLVKNHKVELYWLRPGETHDFIVTSKTSSEEAQSEGSSYVPPMINPGETGVFCITVFYDSETERVVLSWFSIEEEASDYYYVSNDGANWSTYKQGDCSYNNYMEAYQTTSLNSEFAPKGSRRYYKISGDLIIFYVDFPTTYFYGDLYPQKP